MHYHTQLYWQWRASVSADNKFASLNCYKNSSGQDRIDLWEGELDWRRDVERAREAAAQMERVYVAVPGVPLPVPTGAKVPKASPLQQEILRNVQLAADVPGPVSEFFDNHVHDSHAGFWLLGPITQLDKKAFIDEVKSRKAEYDRLMVLAEQTQNPGRSRNFRNQAGAYELNNFEKRVLATDATSPGSMPVMTDADAASMRDRAGFLTSTTLKWMGTATRREAGGHGHYRRIFDRS
jgi:hypothetical protein